MPVNKVSCLWIFLLYLSSEFGVSCGKSYVNNKKKFINLAVFKDYVYIGAETSLILLDSSLKFIDDFKFENEGKINLYRNWLLTVYNNETLIVCNYKSDILKADAYNTKCFNYTVGQISGEDIGQVINFNIKQPSARYLIAQVKDQDLLMIASSSCLNFNRGDKCFAFSGLVLKNGILDMFNPVSRKLKYEVSYNKETAKYVDFKASFQSDKFVYLLYKTEGQSKLGKICTSNPNFNTNSYEDTPIICSYNGINYTVAEDVVHWKEYDKKSWIFVAFSGVSTSVICRYELSDVITIFHKSRKQRVKCPYVQNHNIYFEKQTIKDWCFNETIGQCESKERAEKKPCPEVTNKVDSFCNTTFFGSVEGNLDIISNRVVYTSTDQSSKNGAVVKLGVVPYHTHAVIHAGTRDGKIGQIFVSGTDQKVLGRFRTVKMSSPVLDIKVLNEDVYAMTKNRVVKVAEKDEACPVKSTCEGCMNLTEPACGWDIVSQNCQRNPDNTSWWLPSLGGQCLKLKVEDYNIAAGEEDRINVSLSFEPVVHNFYRLSCQYGNASVSASEVSAKGEFHCMLNVTNETFQLNVTQVDKRILLASTTVNIMKCSSIKSCSSCLDSRRCFWCLQGSSCVTKTKSCPNNLNIKDVSSCPRIQNNRQKLFIHEQKGNEGEDLEVEVANINVYDIQRNELNCTVGNDLYTAEIKNDKHVVCKDVKVPKNKEDMNLYLKYNGSKLANSAELVEYDCQDFKATCGNCMYRKSQGYKCKWCANSSGKKYQCLFYSDNRRCNSTPCTPIKGVFSVYPNSGPENGGTTITIEGIGIGNKGDLTTVTVNDVECSEAKVTKSSVVECKTGRGSSLMPGDINVTISNISVTASNLFSYKKDLLLNSFRPKNSIQAGGKKIRIYGKNIGFPKSVFDISFCKSDNTNCTNCSFIKSLNDDAVQCRMGHSASDTLVLTQLIVIIDYNTRLFLKDNEGGFQFVPNPEVADRNEEEGKVLKSGGSKITLKGKGFNNVGEVTMDNVNEPCTIVSNTEVKCRTPPYVKSDFERRKRATGQTVYVNFDNYRSPSTIYYVEDPTFSKLSNVLEYEEGKEGEPIVIQGRNLLDGARMEDYIINIGLDGQCLIKEMTSWNITCLPPKFKPRTNHSDENIVFVLVKVGNIQDNLGNIRYITALPILAMVIGILGGLLVVAVVLGSALVCVSRRKRKIAEKNFQMELVNMEDKIRETSREEFADAQMTIRDIKSDLVTSRVPYCNYQSYAFHQLFPNQDMDTHPILFEPMVTDDNRRKVQKAMDMFDKLMTNKLFMKSLVQTLESQNKLTPQDKAMFASLLSVCLIGNMKLFYQLINSLLIDMIKSATKKQQKVLFRRFESITQRLVVHWLALSLFDHLKKNGGMQLFMLYKATQTVIEKAPIDAVTILCKNTLAEERLLKNRVEHEILTLDIDLNGNSDQRIPVIVLDCDTITQVKKKCCTAIYKNQPASEIPTPDELELEWHAGKSGKLTLQDIDNISDRSNGMIRLNTLKHYMVKNGSVMALMYKESSGPDDDIYENQHVQGMVPTSTDHVKLLMPETAADNQDLKWHLSNLPDEEKSNKEHEIGEIFLNRLFHTKLILRDYIEACFEGITDSQSLSIPVRYFLCMIDKQGKEVGVDGDILQSWKSECYATRVWASLIAKPQILFDVNVPSHVEPCMDILKQVFIDSFTQCPQHVTKDASTQKLLFCKDIPEYRKNVNSFFIKVEAVNDQEFWKAMDEISSEQTKEMKFSRQATLHQLYKFIAKYKDEIIEDFQEKDETKDLAFGNKLEEVIDLMEEP